MKRNGSSAMFLYLWVLLGLFAIHESIVLAKHNIPYRPFGVALINAWILAKVMLIAEDLKLGEGWFGHRPPIYRILAKAVAFAIVFLLVHFVVKHAGRDVAWTNRQRKPAKDW